jgi:Holliday junction resolvase RusA-like endonuclease
MGRMSRATVSINGREFPVVSGGAPAAPTATKRKARRQIPKPLDGAPVASGTLTLSMVPPSVNGMFFNRAKGKGRGKTLAYRNWQRDAGIEIDTQERWHVPGKVVVRIKVGAGRGDVDNRIKAVLDLLVSRGRIEDDKHVDFVSAERDASVTGASIVIVRLA